MGYQNVYYTVVSGDNLTRIGQRYGVSWQTLYSWNRSTIGSNPNLIYPGQRLIVGTQYVADSGGSNTNTVRVQPYTVSNVGTVYNVKLKQMAGNEKTLFATWEWNRSNTKEYQLEWQYQLSDGQWVVASRTSTDIKQATYTPPDYTSRVCLFIRPVSESRTVNGQQTVYWNANYTSGTYINIQKEPDPVAVPPVPTCTMEEYTLKIDMDNIDAKTTYIELEIIRNDYYLFKKAKVTIMANAIQYSCSVNAGSRYKVRARGIYQGRYSEWSNYCNDLGTKPLAPSGFTSVFAESKDSIRCNWSKVDNAKTYDIQYATDSKYFDVSDNVQTQTGIEGTSFLLTGLDSGNTYYLRLRAVNENGESAWSKISSTVIGTKPIAPTTWSSTTVAIVGEIVYLYWVHNSVDGSSERAAKIELIRVEDGTEHRETVTVTNKDINDEDHRDDTKQYEINTASLRYRDGTQLRWRVQTCGITGEYSDWSVERVIEIYAPPTLEVSIQDIDGNQLNTVTSFPFYVKGLAGPANQTPTSYHVSVCANTSYETTDRIGNKIFIKEGEEIYSGYFDDNNDTLTLEMLPNIIDLQANVEYTLRATVSMDSGLTAEATLEFDVSWIDISYSPTAEISYDKDTVSTYIHPYCTYSKIKRQMLVLKPGQEDLEDKEYVKTGLTEQNADDVVDAEILPHAYYRDVENPYTFIHDDGSEETDDRIYLVYSGKNAKGTEKQYYEYVGEEELTEDISLAIYRREFDGSFTEIATGLENGKNTFVTDPHPALDFARYRIVATDNKTGAIGFADTPAYPVHEIGVIIQWDEEWTNFDVTDEVAEPLSERPWSGSLLRLPYNIDVSDKHETDKELVNYAGRKHPVSYYGTQLGTTSSWNLQIPKEDKETLYAIRRLAIYQGDVYVREPSGTGYWATISVSYNQTHNEVIIPISFEITRVEGGV